MSRAKGESTYVTMTPDRERQFGFGRHQTIHLAHPPFYFGVNARM